MHLTQVSWQNHNQCLLWKGYLQIHPNSLKLYLVTQIIQNSFQNYTTIISTSQVKNIRFRIIHHIRNKHERSGNFHTPTEGRGHPVELCAQVPSRKVNWNWKICHKYEKYQGKFFPKVWSYNLFSCWSVWLSTQEWKMGPRPKPRRQYNNKAPVFLVSWFSFWSY